MKVLEKNVRRLAVLQHLRSVYGIKTKNRYKSKPSSKMPAAHSVNIFGTALDALQHCFVQDYGSVPCFLVDACTRLFEHTQTEGLFRKSGSVARIKALRAKLDQGEDCLSSALPLDVAGLLKQFFRELPEPILPVDLHGALLKAQELATLVERTRATMLLSCVLPEQNLSSLQYFFSFLQSVAKRSAENRMDSNNLSVIFAPNLLHSAEGTEKMNASTERKLRLQAAVVQCFIENAQDFGVVPSMLGCEADLLSPPANAVDESCSHSGLRRSHRRSLGVFSTATPVLSTPNTKRKLPAECAQSLGFSNKKRRSLKKNFGIELLPNPLFGAGSTPGSVQSASGCLDSSHNAAPSAGKMRRLSASSARRKSKRLSYRTNQISRVESGKTGCFSPKVTKKEAVRKSLRLRFSLGRSSKDPGSEAIGWRLATQDSTTSFHLTTEPSLSPAVLHITNAPQGTKFFSSSEDNLLTPKSNTASHRTSWIGETPDRAHAYGLESSSSTPMSMCLKGSHHSEPALATSKPSQFSGVPKTLCCATSVDSLDSSDSPSATGPTLLKVKRAFRESGSDLQAILREHSTSSGEEVKQVENGDTDQIVISNALKSQDNKDRSNASTTVHKCLLKNHNVTFGHIELVPLSPLHMDIGLFEFGASDTPTGHVEFCDVSTCAINGSCDSPDEPESQSVNCSQLIEALDIQSPVCFRLSSSIRGQSTPCKFLEPELKLPSEPQDKIKELPKDPNVPDPHSPSVKQIQALKVADHIKHFNMMTLTSPKNKTVRSPLKFHRTPVKQSVRRINSLNCRCHAATGAAPVSKSPPVIKSISLESGLSSGVQLQPPILASNPRVSKEHSFSKPRPPVLPKKSSFRNSDKPCALGDVTNKVQHRARFDAPVPLKSNSPESQKSAVLQLLEKDMSHYRGSPRNPLTDGRLISATKPIDYC
ncbi:rho GTPase-activating protein 11A-like [Denticeps clupeoides]|uniref:rho GTPase-activating protein 11A-like n=1 Tax=Denticeps clupeoides TaxID=299321 RepID=UPI0010A4BAB3|nr:rho GTPase-activating protein 11A-like [Denticeps clupeoides]